jgi:hypothetical protein
MMIIVVGVAVALTAFILYALDRRSREKPIVWEDAGKLFIFSGLVGSGIVFATTAEIPKIETITEAIKETVPVVEDMFVGSPSF